MFNRLIKFTLLIIALTTINSCSHKNNSKVSTLTIKTKTLLKELKLAKGEEKIPVIKKLQKAQAGEQVKRELMLLFRQRNTKVREQALKAIQDIVAIENVKISIKHSKNKDPNKRYYALLDFKFTNEKFYEEFKVSEILINALDDVDSNVVKAAVNIIAERREKKAIPTLAGFLLKDTYRSKRLFLDALTKIGTEALPYLTKIITDSKWESASANIADILYRIKSPVAYKIMPKFIYATPKAKIEILKLFSKVNNETDLDLILSDFFNNERNRVIKREILKTLRKSQAVVIRSSTLALLLPHLDNSDYKRNIEDLIAAKGENVQYELLSFFKKTNKSNKVSVLNILFKINSPDFIHQLVHLTAENEENKNLIIPYLAKSNDTLLIHFFTKVLTDGNEENKKHAIKFLKEFIYNKDVLNTLVTFINEEPDILLAKFAIKSVAYSNYGEQTLLKIYKTHTNKVLKKISLKLLGKLHSKKAIPYLIEDLKNEPVFTQSNSIALSLIKIGKPAISELIKLLTSQKLPHSAYASWILAKIGDKNALSHIKKLSIDMPDSGIYVLTTSKNPNIYALEYKDVFKYSLNLLEAKAQNSN